MAVLQGRVTGRYNRSHLSRGLVFYHRQSRDILQGWDMSPQCWWSVQGGNIMEISTLLWFIENEMTITVCGRHPTGCHWGPAVSSSRLVVFIGFILRVIPSYTEDWMSAACCCYGLAILLPQLEHQFLFFIGASDRVFRKLFHFKIVRNLLNIYHGIMCYCCFFAQILSHGGSWWNIHWNIFE